MYMFLLLIIPIIMYFVLVLPRTVTYFPCIVSIVNLVILCTSCLLLAVSVKLETNTGQFKILNNRSIYFLYSGHEN